MHHRGKVKEKTDKNNIGTAGSTQILIERTVFKNWYFSVSLCKSGHGESVMTTFTKRLILQQALAANMLLQACLLQELLHSKGSVYNSEYSICPTAVQNHP